MKKAVAKVRALYDYDATTADELSIKAGDVIVLVSDADSDWWQGEVNGITGTFPANYVERI